MCVSVDRTLLEFKTLQNQYIWASYDTLEKTWASYDTLEKTIILSSAEKASVKRKGLQKL